MTKKYYFVLMNYDKSNKISGHAHTLAGVKHIFKKVANAHYCSVFKRLGLGHFGYAHDPFITYQK